MATSKREHKGPCELAKGRFCPGMARVLQDESNRKGIVSMHVFGLSEGYMGTMIAYKRSASDQGLMLNVCPWCKASLDYEKVGKKARKKKARK